jgi:hypothetical protein
MTTFTDTQGRAWNLAVNGDTIGRVKELAGVNLMELRGAELPRRLADDPALLCDVLYAMCKPKADAAPLTDEQFAAAMFGDAIEQATDALLAAFVEFSPTRLRPALQGTYDKLREASDLASAEAGRRIAAIDVGAIVEKAFADVR